MNPRFSHETTIARSFPQGSILYFPIPGIHKQVLELVGTSDLSPEPSSLSTLPPRGSLYLLIPVYCLGCICIVRAHVKERNKTAEPRLGK